MQMCRDIIQTLGQLTQRESASFTWKKSGVRIPYCPPPKAVRRVYRAVHGFPNLIGQLTQLGECLLDVEKVTGSSPVLPTRLSAVIVYER